MSGYKNLKVYQLAKELDNEIFKLTEKFPKVELFSLTDQFRRSTHSVVSNIVEGFGRRIYQQEYSRFLTFAVASCDESREHLQVAFNRRYCLKGEFEILDDKFDHLGRMLTLLIRKVRS